MLAKNLLVKLPNNAPGVGGASQYPLAVHKSSDPSVPSPSTKLDVTNSLKNLKPLLYKCEENDHNKDAVHTFLQKWSDLHALHSTPNEQ